MTPILSKEASLAHPFDRLSAGVFLISFSILQAELILTRIFSVTLWYHFAFVAISVTMFGMAVGALIVYSRPHVFTPARVHSHLARAALGFALTIVGSFLAHLWLPFRPELSLTGILTVVLTYGVLSIPFTFSGIVVALALTRFPQQVSALYAADLAGAAVGYALLGPLLRVTDAPTGIVATAAVAGLGAVCFLPANRLRQGSGESAAALRAKAEAGSYQSQQSLLRRVSLSITLVFAAFAVVHTYAVRHDSAWLRLVWAAVLLLLIARPRPSDFTASAFRACVILGVVTASTTMLFMAAVARLPLGTASALEFLGPLTVAIVRGRSGVRIWPVVAAVGVLLLTQPWTGQADPIGVAFALAAGVSWGTYIVLTQHVGDEVDGLKPLAKTEDDSNHADPTYAAA